MPRANGVISITTDFGMRDGFVGTMKGVILSRFPLAELVDISHDIPRQDILAGAMVLAHAVPFFPEGTTHLAVVDPGVGSQRHAMVAVTDHAFYVLPDNGLISLVDVRTPVRESFSIDHPTWRLPEVSHTFHGRDVFAPAAARLAAGEPPSSAGARLTDFQRINIPQARHQGGRIHGEITYVDVYGNLFTNIEGRLLGGVKRWQLTIGAIKLEGPCRAYADRALGQPLFLIGSSGYVEIAINGGNAAKHLGLERGADVLMRPAGVS